MRRRSSRLWALGLATLAGWAGAHGYAPPSGPEPLAASVTRGPAIGLPLEAPSSVSVLAAPTADAPNQSDGHPQPSAGGGATALSWRVGAPAAQAPGPLPAALLALTANPATGPPRP